MAPALNPDIKYSATWALWHASFGPSLAALGLGLGVIFALRKRLWAAFWPRLWIIFVAVAAFLVFLLGRGPGFGRTTARWPGIVKPSRRGSSLKPSDAIWSPYGDYYHGHALLQRPKRHGGGAQLGRAGLRPQAGPQGWGMVPARPTEALIKHHAEPQKAAWSLVAE